MRKFSTFLSTFFSTLLTPLLFVISTMSCGGGASNPPTSPTPPIIISAPTLSADQLVFDSDRTGNHEIFVMKANGTELKQLTNDSKYENWWARISPNRKTVLFYRSPAGKPENYTEASLWLMNVDGTGVTQLRAKGADGWTLQGHAEWSPDGNKIAMFGSAGSALEIFVTDALGKNPVQYTRRGGINTDVSWSPDGSKLLFNGCAISPCVPANYEIFVMAASAFSPATQLTNNGLADYDPYFSPDGTKIAWLVNVDPTKFPIGDVRLGAWAIRIANADGSNPAYLINDGNINSKPAWSLDGRTIFFHRMELDPFVEGKFGVFRIDITGSGLTRLTNVGYNNEHPSN